jgi:hypothetical protein
VETPDAPGPGQQWPCRKRRPGQPVTTPTPAVFTQYHTGPSVNHWDMRQGKQTAFAASARLDLAMCASCTQHLQLTCSPPATSSESHSIAAAVAASTACCLAAASIVRAALLTTALVLPLPVRPTATPLQQARKQARIIARCLPVTNTRKWAGALQITPNGAAQRMSSTRCRLLGQPGHLVWLWPVCFLLAAW